MINRVILIGRLTKDIVIRKTPSGQSVCTFTLAVNRRKSKDATNQSDADFINCIGWNQTADILNQYTHKGSQIGVEGRIQTRNYDDPNVPNKKVYVTEVVADTIMLLDSKEKANVEEEHYTLDITSDDLPF